MTLEIHDGMKPVQSEGPATKPTHSGVKFWLAVAVAAALIAVAVAAGLVPRWREQTELGGVTRELAIPAVTVVSPEPGQTASGLPLPAELKPRFEAPIYARANGYLKRRFVDIGARVEAGELLVEIDTPELDQELERARAQLAEAEAALGLSKITAARWAELLKAGIVTEQDNAEKQADFKLKTAASESARAEVRRLEKLKSFARITAPFAGTITVRNVDAGDLVVAGAGKELFHLAHTRTLRVYVQVPQEMALRMNAGQSAQLIVPELAGRAFTAKVIRTAGMLAADSRTLLVELEMDNPKGEILAGSFAQVRFSHLKMEALLTLPANAFLFRAQGHQVAVVQPDGKVELRTVKLGRDFGQTIEILAGVSPSDRVIVNPSESLAAGTTVSVVQADKKGKNQRR